MMKRIVKISGYILLIILAVILTRILWPQHYDVPKPVKRSGTQFWNLSTGSRIGYTMIPATGMQKDVPIVYLHGGPGGSVSDEDISVLSPLAKDGFSLYFYDQVGSGNSARLNNIREYTVDRHMKDLLEIIHLTGSGKVTLIGQSWGAILAVLFAAEFPEKVAKIVLTSPGPIYPFRNEVLTASPPDSLHFHAPYYSNRDGNKKAKSLRTDAMAYLARNYGMKLAGDEEADEFSTFLSSLVNRSTVCDTSRILKARGGSGYYAQFMTLQARAMIPDGSSKIRNIKA